MDKKLIDDIFYVCSLIEYTARKTKNHRGYIVKCLGMEGIRRQLKFAEINHCLSFEEVSDEIIEEYGIKTGSFDTVSECKYTVPSYLAIGRSYQRLITSVSQENNLVQTISDVFTSFISDEISDFNSSTYYQNPSYLKWSYLEGKLLD